MDRPTFASIEETSDGETLLAVSMDTYGSYESSLRFSKTNVDGYISLIDKYSKWEDLAKSRKDAFTKEIGSVNTWGNGPQGTLKFIFHSGNEHSHYLSITYCAAGTCLDDYSLYFDDVNAKALKSILSDLKVEKIHHANINDIYN